MRVSWTACALALIAALGCNNDTEGTREGTGPSEPAEKKVSAEDGGKVRTTGVQAEIPAGALSEDTKITIDVLDRDGLPDVDNVASKVFDFGPDGTTFDQPITLTIDFDAARTPEDERAVMAFLDGDAWQVLPDSEVDDNSVVATTTHFTPFAVIFVPADQIAESCDEVDFDPCGGDLIGTWQFKLSCLTLSDEALQAAKGPFAMCDGVELSVSADLDGEITFGEDGAFEIKQSIVITIDQSVPKDCLMADETCETVGAGKEESIDKDDHCEISESHPSDNYDLGTYTVDDNTFSTTSEGVDQPSAPEEYCVDGNTLTIRAVTEGQQTSVFQAVRK